MSERPIFFDPSGRRARGVSRLGWIFAIATTIIAIFFVTTIIIVPQAPQLHFGRNSHLHALTPDKVVAPRLLKNAVRLAREARARQAGIPRSTHPQTMPIADPHGAPATITTPTGRRKSGANRWRTQGQMQISDGRVVHSEGELDLATRVWSGKLYTVS